MKGHERNTICLALFVFLAAFWLLDLVGYIDELESDPLGWAQARIIGASRLQLDANRRVVPNTPAAPGRPGPLGLTSKWQRVVTINPGEADETSVFARLKGDSVNIIVVRAGERDLYF